MVIILSTGSEVRGFDGFFSERKSPEYEFLRVVDLRHVKVPQAEISAVEQNLSDFSLSMSEATLDGLRC